MRYEIIEYSNTCTITNGEDELYHIIPSGLAEEKNRYIVVDGGPHFNGTSVHMGKDLIFKRFGVMVDQPEFDNVCPECNGEGEVEKNIHRGEEGMQIEMDVMVVCNECGGSGKVSKQ